MEAPRGGVTVKEKLTRSHTGRGNTFYLDTMASPRFGEDGGGDVEGETEAYE